MEDLTAADAENYFQEYARFTNWLKTKGHFVGANRLKPASTAATIRVRDGKTTVTDGPFAETKEQIGGYYLINAKNLDEAIKIAARIPGAQRGSVEVRSIADDAQTLALGLE
jgi:hypothetical protein